MTENTARTPVSLHTEYVRTRTRCLQCGGYVTADRGAGESLCKHCAS